MKFDGAIVLDLNDANHAGLEGEYHERSFALPGTIAAGAHALRFEYSSPAAATKVTDINVDDISLNATPVPPPPPGGEAPKSGGAAPIETTITAQQLFKAKQGKKGSAKRVNFAKTGKSGKAAKAKFSFTGTGGEGALSFECKLDGGAFAPCSSPTTYNKLKLGRHTFEVRAVDRAGNKDATPATASFKATAGKSGKFKK